VRREFSRVCCRSPYRLSDRVARPPSRHRVDRAAQASIPPLCLMNWSRGSESNLYTAACVITRDHLLLVRLSALAGSAVHRIMAANGSSRSKTFNRCNRKARRARSISLPSADHQATRVHGGRVRIDSVSVAAGPAIVPDAPQPFEVRSGGGGTNFPPASLPDAVTTPNCGWRD
jgi:hypothetical protein